MSESSAVVDASAFDLVPQDYDGRAAALCLHGLTGTPYEMRPIAQELVRRGVRCVGPVMAGHDRTLRELAGTSHREWVELAGSALARLRTQSERVFVVGLSMGGLVTLALAAENRADAVAVLATPLRFSPLLRLLLPLLRVLRPYWRKSQGEGIQNEVARARYPGFDAIPLASMRELIRLQAVARAGLPRITAPILVGHGALDLVANPRDARTIFGEVNADVRALQIGARSGHIISVDYDGPDLALAIADFFEQRL